MEPTTTAIGGTLLVLSPYLKKLLGPTATEIGAKWGDSWREWRKQNLMRVFEKTEEMAKEKGYDPQPLRPALLVPLMEAAQNVDDETLADMFAHLLNSAADPEGDSHPAYAKTVAEMTPTDAKLLHIVWRLYQKKVRISGSYEKSVGYSEESALKSGKIGSICKKHLGINKDAYELSISNLTRLGIVLQLIDFDYDDGTTSLTTFGERFLTASVGKR